MIRAGDRVRVAGRGAGVVVRLLPRRTWWTFGRPRRFPPEAIVELDDGSGRTVRRLADLELESDPRLDDERELLARLERIRQAAVDVGALGTPALDEAIANTRTRIGELEAELAGEVPPR